MKARNGNVDLAKFIAAIIIMTHHSYKIGQKFVPFGWIYVEFFLFICGYYAAKHFDKEVEKKDKIRNSILYTIRKFALYVPYVFIATVLMNILIIVKNVIFGEVSITEYVCILTNSVFDVLLLSSGLNIEPMIGPVWYLSSLFLVFPLFALLLQNNRYFIMLISGLFSVCYYGMMGIQILHTSFPINLLRVLAGICLGAFIYEITYVFRYYFELLSRLVWTIIEVVSFVVPMILVFMNKTDLLRLVVLCFAICVTSMLSNLSFTCCISGKVFSYLGKLSMLMFIFHWFVGSFAFTVGTKLMFGDMGIIILYYCGTLMLSIIMKYMIDHWKWFNNILAQPLVLKE